MNFYEAIVRFKQMKVEEENESRSLFTSVDTKNTKQFFKDVYGSINNSLGVNCDERGAFSIFFWEAENGRANVIFSVDMGKADKDEAISYIKNYLEENYDICALQISDIKEVTTERSIYPSERIYLPTKSEVTGKAVALVSS